MQPIQESPNMSAPTPFQGDKIYVLIDLIFFLSGYAMMLTMFSALTDEGYKNAVAQGQQVTLAQVQGVTMGIVGCTAVLCAPINIVFWINMIKGKKWSLIAMIVLVAAGLLLSIPRISGPMMAWTIFSIIVSMVKLVYLSMRVAKKFGPDLI